MHVLDISNGGRQLRWYQPAVKGTPPGPCNMHSADYVTARKEVYVFRGGNGREYLNDLHALDTTTLTWRQVETTGAIPQQRANHSSSILDETGELFIFGGWYVPAVLSIVIGGGSVLARENRETDVCVCFIIGMERNVSMIFIFWILQLRHGRVRMQVECCRIREQA
jgi:hypothetical protein